MLPLQMYKGYSPSNIPRNKTCQCFPFFHNIKGNLTLTISLPKVGDYHYDLVMIATGMLGFSTETHKGLHTDAEQSFVHSPLCQ